MDPLTIGTLAASGVTKLIGEGMGANKRERALETRNNYYDYAGSLLDSQYYRDPLSMTGNRSLLKEAKQNYADNVEAANNLAEARGATLENRLAVRQMNNESLDKLQLRLLQNEDARRERNRNQKMNIEGQRAQDNANAFYQQAQDWQSWGSQGAQAILDFGKTYLLDGGLSSAAPDVSDIQGALERDALTPSAAKDLQPMANAPTFKGADFGGLKGLDRVNPLTGQKYSSYAPSKAPRRIEWDINKR